MQSFYDRCEAQHEVHDPGMPGDDLKDAIMAVLSRRGNSYFTTTKLTVCLYFLKFVGELDLNLDFPSDPFSSFAPSVLRAQLTLEDEGIVRSKVSETLHEVSTEYKGVNVLTLTPGAKSGLVLSPAQEKIIEELKHQSVWELELLCMLFRLSRMLDSRNPDFIIGRARKCKKTCSAEKLAARWRWLQERGWFDAVPFYLKDHY